ncbi:hypothetical protein ACJX0J_018068, partial [Zea mays]
ASISTTSTLVGFEEAMEELHAKVYKGLSIDQLRQQCNIRILPDMMLDHNDHSLVGCQKNTYRYSTTDGKPYQILVFLQIHSFLCFLLIIIGMTNGSSSHLIALVQLLLVGGDDTIVNHVLLNFGWMFSLLFADIQEHFFQFMYINQTTMEYF